MSNTDTKKKPLAVVKVGGDILLDEDQKRGLAKNIKGLITQGWNVIVLHGGGPQVTNLQKQLGLKTNKIAGRRITSPQDLAVVKKALCGEVNVDLVAALQGENINAFGFHGASGRLILSQKRPLVAVSGGGDELIDFGEVGDVTSINSNLLYTFLAAELVPVIASLGVNNHGRVFNINADTTVVQIAKSVSADLLVFVTGIGGIYTDINDRATRLASLNADSAKKYIEQGVIVDGMIPKVEEALSLLETGVDSVAIVDTRDPNAFLSISNNEDKFGTRIVREP